jgi:16S rRNA C1402 (ribose-2'-O) methylase RsmI
VVIQKYHSYADDTQVYLVNKPLNNWNNISIRLEPCLPNVSVLMISNMLKLNQDETELIVFASTHRVKELSECCLSFDGTIVSNASFF